MGKKGKKKKKKKKKESNYFQLPPQTMFKRAEFSNPRKERQIGRRNNVQVSFKCHVVWDFLQWKPLILFMPPTSLSESIGLLPNRCPTKQAQSLSLICHIS